MDTLQSVLMERREILEKTLQVAERELNNAPAGTLRVDCSKTTPQYYFVSGENSHGKYISRTEILTAEQLARKDYLERFVMYAKKELRLLDRYMSLLANHRAEHVYRNLNEARRRLVSPIMLDDEMYVDFWQNTPFEGNPYHLDELRIQTRRGEKVRSKSEAFQANIYYELGIPYRYEYPLELPDGHVLYPDFTLLNRSSRQVIFHEHFGLLDDDDYRSRAMKKVNEYERNGIFVGKNLIITSESSDYPFNPEMFRKRMKETFCV